MERDLWFLSLEEVQSYAPERSQGYWVKLGQVGWRPQVSFFLCFFEVGVEIISVSPPRMPKTEVTMALPLYCHTQLLFKVLFYLSLGLLAGSLWEHGLCTGLCSLAGVLAMANSRGGYREPFISTAVQAY